MTDKLKELKLQPNVNYVGNFKPFPHKHADELLEYFDSKGMEVILTLEGKENVEHIHFFVSRLTLKKETISKQLRDKFPFLKRPIKINKKTGKNTRGGERRLHIEPLRDKYQYYYIFKEYDEKNEDFFKTNHFKPYSEKTLKANKKKQLTYLEAFSGGSKGKFLQYLIDNGMCSPDPQTLMQRHLDYQREFNHSHITVNNTIANINYVLLKKYPKALKNYFQDSITRYYERP